MLSSDYSNFDNCDFAQHGQQLLYRAIKLICNGVIHGFESVCLLRVICRDLTYVSSCDYWSVEFKYRHTISDSWITRLQINLIAL
jgi:hypothetical protein